MKTLFLALFAIGFAACQPKEQQPPKSTKSDLMEQKDNMETATFAGGCFWCTEAVFLELEGVKSVVSGYIGGTVQNPTYEQVSSGTTGHAEATQIIFDPNVISYDQLLEIYFATHDPTTLNRQGADIGTQYRSEIFYNSEDQKIQAEDYISLMTAQRTFPAPIVTRVSAATEFFAAENYHQNYYSRNQNQSYCSYVITPKVQKVRKVFADKLKK